MAGVMMLDLSAAFDLVDHGILLQKLEIMGFSADTISWFSSYLGDRSQCVYVDGQLSNFNPVHVGVPQGSVLGALLYILYVNDLPSVVENSDSGPHHDTYWKTLCCYVDDSTCTCVDEDPKILTEKLTSNYSILSGYFRDNRLVINDGKTHLIVMGTRRHAHLREQVYVDTGTIIVRPVDSEKLLGLNLHQSLKWKYHLISSDNSLIKCLTKRLGALKFASRNASFKTRLLLANACFMSVATYMISLWGGSEKYLVKAMQVIQNKAARYVTNVPWYTPTRLLLKQCGWLSMKQLIFFHTAVQVWKSLASGTPVSIHNRLVFTSTRSRVERTLLIPVVETGLAKNSFSVRAATNWNKIPPDIRNVDTIGRFKSKLKAWIQTTIDID